MSSIIFGIDIDRDTLMKCDSWAEVEAMIAGAVRTAESKKSERGRHNQDCLNWYMNKTRDSINALSYLINDIDVDNDTAECEMLCEAIAQGLFRLTKELDSMRHSLARFTR